MLARLPSPKHLVGARPAFPFRGSIFLCSAARSSMEMAASLQAMADGTTGSTGFPPAAPATNDGTEMVHTTEDVANLLDKEACGGDRGVVAGGEDGRTAIVVANTVDTPHPLALWRPDDARTCCTRLMQPS